MSLVSKQLLDNQYVMNTFARKPVDFVRGQGMSLFDSDGKEYFDFLSGIGVLNLGHCNEGVVEAICEQVSKLAHVSNYFHVEHRGELAQQLVELYGYAGKVFFANSGAEANEGAIKLARKWGHEHKPEATTILTLGQSFHGRTLATVAATGQPDRAVPFAPVMPGFKHITLNDIDELEQTMGSDTVAILIEVIQGESGVWPAAYSYVERIDQLCAEHNVLLIVDEVQSGMYRTGRAFGFQHYDIQPDIITLAKGLGNGYPIGAVIARDEIADTFQPGDHGSTFGGGPVACAAALATVQQMRTMSIEGVSLAQHVESLGEYAREQLAGISGIESVRGEGLMIGFSLANSDALSASALADALLETGFIVNAIGQEHIRLLPPLVCRKSHIDALIGAIYAIIATE